jgi:glucose dehydrogenase
MRAPRSEFRRKVTGSLIAVALCVVAGALTHSAVPEAPNWKLPPTRDFPLAGGSYSNQRYSALNQINSSNIKKLGGVWSMRVEERGRGGTLDGTPVVVDGVMYVTTGARNVLAIDVKTGDVKWRYRPSPS